MVQGLELKSCLQTAKSLNCTKCAITTARTSSRIEALGTPCTYCPAANPHPENEQRRALPNQSQAGSPNKTTKANMTGCSKTVSVVGASAVYSQGLHDSDSNHIWRQKCCLSETHNRKPTNPQEPGAILSTQPHCKSSQSIQMICLWLEAPDLGLLSPRWWNHLTQPAWLFTGESCTFKCLRSPQM